MKKRMLGRTGLMVSELSLGGVFISSGYGFGYEESRKAVLEALASGINYIDTAPMYGDSEEILGSILKDYDNPIILSTKLGARPEPFLPKDRDCLMRSVDNSLEKLGRDYIDILMIHEPDRPELFDWWSDSVHFEGPVMEVISELKRQGIIRYIGLGGTTSHKLAQIVTTGKFDVVLTAFNYNALWRETEKEILPAAKKHGMGIIIGAPLQQGALARRYDAEIKAGVPWLNPSRKNQFLALYDFLDDINMSLPEIGIRFVISNSDISSVLIGARTAQEAVQNAATVEKGPLPSYILGRLNEIAAMVPIRPPGEANQFSFERKQ